MEQECYLSQPAYRATNESFSSASSASSSYDIEVDVGRDVLTQISCSLLSRILDFPDSKLEMLLGETGDLEEPRDDHNHYHLARNISSGFKHMKKSIEKGIHSFAYHRQGLHRMKEEPAGPVALVFGSTIPRDNSLVILQLISHMHKYTSQEGVFRKPGNKLRISQLVEELSKGRFHEVLQDSITHPHDLASILKQYFAELQEPLLLSRHLDAYLQIAGLHDATLQLRCLQLLALMLPVMHRLVLQHLLELLHTVSCNSQSKMDAHALAVVFAPNLIWPPSESHILSGVELNKMVSLVEVMIENHTELFEVPQQVQAPAREYLKKKRSGELDAAIEMPGTYCQRVRSKDFHILGRERMIKEVALLYGTVQKMPEGSRKHHLLKKFENNHRILGTPKAFVVNKRKKTDDSSTPLRIPLDKGIGCDEMEEAEEAEEVGLEPRHKRLRMHSSLELMKLRIQSTSSDQDTDSTTPDTPMMIMDSTRQTIITTPYKVTPI